MENITVPILGVAECVEETDLWMINLEKELIATNAHYAVVQESANIVNKNSFIII